MEVKERLAEPIVRRRSDCRLCHGEKLAKVWSFGQTPLANSYLKPEEVGKKAEITAPLDVYYCRDCHLVQLLDIVSPHELFDEYLYVSSTSPKYVQHFTDYARHLIGRFALNEESLVVDVGSNDGILLKPLQAAGIKVLGIDPAVNIARTATVAGIPTWAEYFTPPVAQRVKDTLGAADVITANNVFAHTDGIDTFVEAVKTLLADNGVFVFEVQYVGDILAKNLFDIVYHEHVNYYSLHPLVAYFERQGMTVVDVQHPPVHGGSLRVFVKLGAGHAVSDSVAKMLQAEKEAGMMTIQSYLELKNHVAANKIKLRELLAGLKEKGHKIAGYGAPAKATTLMHVLGIDGKDLDFIVDDSPYKQGLVMPGTHVPIVPPTKLYNSGIDYCLILAWNFADAIMEKHKLFAKSGGRFIVPVPEPRII